MRDAPVRFKDCVRSHGDKDQTAFLPMNFRASYFVVAGWIAVASALSSVAAEGITIHIQAPAVSRKTFDPENPPPEMPKLKPTEVGTCVYAFGCTTDMDITGSRNSPARVSGIGITTTLKITIWTPRAGPPKILQHEEGHRMISEMYYAQAEAVAQRLAQREMNRALKYSMADKAAAEQELNAIQNKVIADFMAETARRCDVAEAYYDEITQHSRNPISESAAILQAVAAERSGQPPTPAVPSASPSTTP